MVTKDRARLDPDTVDELLFLNSYYKRKESIPKLEVKDEEKVETTAEIGSSTQQSLPNLKFEN